MNGALLNLEVVTPEGLFLKQPVDMIEFPSEAGELGILGGHVPILTSLATGELRVYQTGRIDYYAVAGGYVQVLPELVRVVATFAITGAAETEIDAACQRAKSALETAAAEDPALIAAEIASLKGALIRLSQQRPKKRGPLV